jgi:hypothetical protein
MSALESIAVTNFRNSTNRWRAFEQLRAVIGIFEQWGLPFEVWVDGSFMTDKPSPNDIDVVFIYEPHDMELLRNNAEFMRVLPNNFNEIRTKHDMCDIYIAMRGLPSEEYRELFGSSRAGKPKGIAVITVTS